MTTKRHTQREREKKRSSTHHATATRISRVKNANEMQNKRELNGSNESRCTEMSGNNRTKLRRRREEEKRAVKHPNWRKTLGHMRASDRVNRDKRANIQQFRFSREYLGIFRRCRSTSIHTRHTHSVIASAYFLFLVTLVPGCWLLPISMQPTELLRTLQTFIRQCICVCVFSVLNGVISYQWHRARWIHDVIFPIMALCYERQRY